jgi:hypothetical protein
VECFGGWGKGEPGEARGWGGPARAGKDWAGGGGTGEEGPGGGGAWAGKDQARGSSTGALCTGFTLVQHMPRSRTSG